MKSAVLIQPGKLDFVSVSTPPCPEGGVLVQVKVCGICSADYKMVVQGHRELVYPRVLGHEIAGVIAKSHHADFNVGDRVQVAPGLRCGECRFCRAGADNQCRQRQILGFSRDGGLAEYVPVPLQGPLKGGVTLLPDHLSFTRAIWVEPLACCLHAQNRIQVKAEDVVLIIGAGPVGLLHLLLAVHKGVAELLMAEVSPYRRSLAKIMGASQVLDSTRSDFLDRIMALTDGRGVDVLILACSGMGFDKKLAGLMAPTGRISFFSGLPEAFCVLNVNANQIHYHEWILAGAYGCTLKDIHEAIALLADYSFPVGGITTQKVSLDQVASVFTYNRSDKELKTIVEVDYDGADY